MIGKTESSAIGITTKPGDDMAMATGRIGANGPATCCLNPPLFAMAAAQLGDLAIAAAGGIPA
jgi:hypothetical protein